jgi:NhaP-type Na+/H+ or K+/H+ antiporter
MVFLITGLQARTVIGRISHYPLSQLALSVAVITAVVIVARFVWVFPATYLPPWLFPPERKKDPSPPWQWPFVLAFTGVGGIVSLAAALAIPLATSRLLIAAERTRINDLYRSGKLKDEARRRIERELDLREAHLSNQQRSQI